MQLKKILIVLDLNGTILHRIIKTGSTTIEDSFVKIAKMGKHSLYARPYLKDFFDFLVKYFDVAVWTSAEERNALAMIDSLSTSVPNCTRNAFKFIWSRNMCTLQEQSLPLGSSYIKPLALKKLSKIWQKFPTEFDYRNTIIIDDSEEKIHDIDNLLLVPTLDVSIPTATLDTALLQLIDYLQHITNKYSTLNDDVRVLLRENKMKFNQ